MLTIRYSQTILVIHLGGGNGVDDEMILALNGWPTAEMKRLESPKEPTEAKQFS